MLHDWPVLRGARSPAYDHCLASTATTRAGSPSSTSTSSCSRPPAGRCPRCCADYEQLPGVGVNWADFGTSGHEHQAARPRDRELRAHHSQPRRAAHDQERRTACRDVCGRELPPLRLPRRRVRRDANGWSRSKARIFTRTETVSRDVLRINHYVTRSVEDSKEKRSMPRADTGEERRFGGSPPHGDVPDDVIQMFAPAVRDAVAAAEQRIARRSASN